MNSSVLFDLHGRTALVTGGSGVLGSVMARGLAQAGARVAVLGRREEPALAVAATIRAAGGEAIGVAADVLDRTALERANETITATLGPADILINGAGGNQPQATTGPDRSFFHLELAAIRHAFDANVTGAIVCSQVFGRVMAERRQGCIINVASMAGIRPLTRVVTYSTAKAALINFTQWLAVHMAQEYSPHIRVNAIAPGFFLTEQNRYLLVDNQSGSWTARGSAIVKHTPMGRLGAPEDLIGTLIWLASPASAFVTGAVIPVDGGFSSFSGV
jgi:NAD(P)-dependent dehydrogenase (short-subunit alcohol dehydrogenase family)